MRVLNRGIAPQAYNRQQRQQRAGVIPPSRKNDGMKDLEDAYIPDKKRKSSDSNPDPGKAKPAGVPAPH
jgi:hypothetical protein